MNVSRRISFVISVFLFCGIVWGAQQATSTRTVSPGQQSSPNSPTQQNRAKVTGVVMNAGSDNPCKALVTLMPVMPAEATTVVRAVSGQTNQAGQPGQTTPQLPSPGKQPGRGQQTQTGQNGQNGQRGGGGGARSVTTGDDGVFTFEDVAPGPTAPFVSTATGFSHRNTANGVGRVQGFP
jgi:hypothetical protein